MKSKSRNDGSPGGKIVLKSRASRDFLHRGCVGCEDVDEHWTHGNYSESQQDSAFVDNISVIKALYAVEQRSARAKASALIRSGLTGTGLTNCFVKIIRDRLVF